MFDEAIIKIILIKGLKASRMISVSIIGTRYSEHNLFMIIIKDLDANRIYTNKSAN